MSEKEITRRDIEMISPFLNEYRYHYDPDFYLPQEAQISGYSEIVRTKKDWRINLLYNEEVANEEKSNHHKTIFRFLGGKLREELMDPKYVMRKFDYLGDKLCMVETFNIENDSKYHQNSRVNFIDNGENDYMELQHLRFGGENSTRNLGFLGESKFVNNLGNFVFSYKERFSKSNRSSKYTESYEHIFGKERVKSMKKEYNGKVISFLIFDYSESNNQIKAHVHDQVQNKYGMTITYDDQDRILQKGIYDKTKSTNIVKHYVVNVQVQYNSDHVLIEEFRNSLATDYKNGKTRQFTFVKDKAPKSINFIRRASATNIISDIGKKITDDSLITEWGYIKGKLVHQIEYSTVLNSEDVLVKAEGYLRTFPETTTKLVYYYNLEFFK